MCRSVDARGCPCFHSGLMAVINIALMTPPVITSLPHLPPLVGHFTSWNSRCSRFSTLEADAAPSRISSFTIHLRIVKSILSRVSATEMSPPRGLIVPEHARIYIYIFVAIVRGTVICNLHERIRKRNENVALRASRVGGEPKSRKARESSRDLQIAGERDGQKGEKRSKTSTSLFASPRGCVGEQCASKYRSVYTRRGTQTRVCPTMSILSTVVKQESRQKPM